MAAVLEPGRETSPALSFYDIEVNNSREAILENIAANLDLNLPGLKQLEATEIPLAIVAGGPSLHDYLPVLRSFVPDCHVLSVNGAYKFLRSVGIESDHFILIDSRDGNVSHIDSPHDRTIHYLASQVHPSVFDALRGHEVRMFHLATETGVEGTKHLPDPKSYLVSPIGVASVYAIYLAAALGYRKLFLFGYDFSQRGDQSYAFNQPLNNGDKHFVVDLNGKKFQTTMLLARVAEQFGRAVTPIINSLDLDIRMMCSGLLPEILKVSQERCTEESERVKYEQIWNVDLYRKISPGLESVEDAVAKLEIPAGSSVADFGCGTGRCVKWFQDRGFTSVGVDIAGNCLEESVPFIQAALWDAERLPKVDYGFSCDVLEHIPSERVREVLRAIFDSVRVGCYLNVDTIPDSFGLWIGKTLHETVMPGERWLELLKELWPQVDYYPGERQAVFVCRK